MAPTSGPIGTSVTITGSGFNATASQNVVFFGATQAAVTAAGATSLTVTVPLGATYQYPTVTNLTTALTAYAAQPFVATFNGDVIFGPNADFTTGPTTNPVAVAIADVDGKPDLVAANAISGNVSVLRNTTTAGGAVSFATRVNCFVGTNPYAVAIGDVDVDGKPDLVTASQTNNNVSVLRNTATAGRLSTSSFATAVNFAVDTSPYAIAVGDLDGDGKPDLATANYGGGKNTVSVLSQVARPVISSFTPASGPVGTSVTITGTGLDNATSVTFGGSGTQTIITNPSSTSLNVAVPANANTGPLVVTTFGTNPSAASSQTFAVVPVITGFMPASGPIGASVTITGTGLSGPISVSFNGTVQTRYLNPTTTSLTVAVPAGATTGPLTITTTGGTSAASSQSFTVVPKPVISSFTPASGPAGTSVTITGTNLDNATSVRFNGTAQATITNSTATGLTVAVPAGTTTGPVTVTTPIGTSNGLTFTVTTCAATAQAQNVRLTLGADGTATLAASAVDNGSSSPCGAVTLSVAPASFTCANLGDNPVTLTVTAPDGTTATATATTTVSAPALTSTTWTGTTSADASDCRNWSYGQLPTATIGAVVPAGTPYAPALPAGTFATLGLSVASGTTFSTTPATTLQVSGSLSLDGATTFAGPVQLVGTANQTLGGQVAPGFSTLTLAKPAGTVVQLQRDLPIATSLILSGGTLATASYRVQLGATATLSKTDASYVLGNVAATRTLAPGTAESFGGLSLTLTPAAGSLAPGLTPVVRTTGTVLTGVGTSQSIKRYFDIQPATDQGLNVDLDFGYFAHELNNTAVANLRVFKSSTTAGPWQGLGASSATTDAATASGTVRLTGISSFSIWTLGDAANPLPVTLTSFTATAGASGTVRLAWATASEVNSARFEVERSLDGVAFAQIGTLAAAGRSTQAHTYTLLDAALPARASRLYYRLQQVDVDGAAHYSPVRAVALAGAGMGLSLYPNPARGGAVTLAGASPGAAVTVLDALGRLVATATADAQGTAALAGLAPGVYVVRVGQQAVRLTVE